MKLQYYLRGLGIGILVTAMIFCILPGEKEALTDEEIRVRAAELGMVESSSLTLADIQDKQQEEAKTQKPEETQPVEETQQAEATQESVENESATTLEITENPKTPSAESETATEQVEITIPGGASSYTVSKLLQENLLVEDAAEFDNYLCNNGYSRSIRVGNHKIPVGATWEEIAKIITNPLQ